MRRFATGIALLALLLGLSGPARAGSVGTVIEAPNDGALALTVSQAFFPGRSTENVVVANPKQPAQAAIAAAFAGGGLPSRAPLLFADAGVSDALVRNEIARVTGGAGGTTPPNVWLVGTDVDGLGAYDVHHLDGSAAAVAAAIFAEGAAAGTGERVALFTADDWPAGAVAAGFGAAYGVPVVTGTGVPETLATTSAPVAIAVGAVTAPSGRFSRVVAVTGDGPAGLSAAAAAGIVANENPAGAPLTIPRPVEPVAADGFGADPGPALLASVVAAVTQDRGSRGPVLLVDGRPPADLAGGCQRGGRDAAALCFLDKADGATTVLALTGTKRQDGAPLGGRLPGTGGWPLWPLPTLAIVGALAVLVARRAGWAR
jgi:hypothetical protein